MNKEGVLVVGSANMDLVVTSERFPNPGETVFGKNFAMFPGGKGANQAVSCAKLGCNTYFIGKMGNDDFQGRLKESLSNNGVDISEIIIDQHENSGVALISVDSKGENEIIVISGTNMGFMPEDLVTKTHLFRKVKIVLSQLEIPISTVEVAAKIAKENNAIFILNPAPAANLSDELLSKVDYLIPNETELELLAGFKIENIKDAEEGAKILLEKNVKNVIVTLGINGSLLVNKDRTCHFSAIKVKAKDSTAAGDCFNGAFAYSLERGESVDDAILFANYAAALSVTKLGAQSSMPSYSEVEDLFHFR